MYGYSPYAFYRTIDQCLFQFHGWDPETDCSDAGYFVILNVKHKNTVVDSTTVRGSFPPERL